MKHIIIAAILAVFGAFAWHLGSRLSPDALGLAVGLIFGVFASIPAGLLLLAVIRRQPAESAGRVTVSRSATQTTNANSTTYRLTESVSAPVEYADLVLGWQAQQPAARIVAAEPARIAARQPAALLPARDALAARLAAVDADAELEEWEDATW